MQFRKRLKKGTNALEFLATFPILYIAILFVMWIAFMFFFKCLAGSVSTEAVSRDSYALGRGSSFISKMTSGFNGSFSYSTTQTDNFTITNVRGTVSEDWLGWLGTRTSPFQTTTIAPNWKFEP
jgi:hypothetical protein